MFTDPESVFLFKMNRRLVTAAVRDEVDVVRRLCKDTIVDVNFKHRGSTALHVACLKGRVRIAKLLFGRPGECFVSA